MLTLVLTAVLSCPAQIAIEVQPGIAVPAIPPVIGRPVRPTGTSPTMMTMQVKDGKLVSERTATIQKAVPVSEKIAQADGTTVEVTKMVIKSVEEKQTISYPVEGTTFQTADGKKIDAEVALKKLKNPKLVVVAMGKVDESLLGALKADTLVVMPAATSTGIIRPGIRPLPAPLPPVKVKPGAIAPLPPVEVKPLPAPAVDLPLEIKPVEKPKR